MLALAKRLYAYSRQAGESLAATRSIVRWDTGSSADDLRAVVLELEENGQEELAQRIENVEQALRQQSDLLLSEAKYGERILGQMEEDLIVLHNVPLDEAVDVSLAYAEVSGIIRDLQDYGPVDARAHADERVSRLRDEATETLHALRVAIDSTFDTGITTPELDAYADSFLFPPAEWERELEQDGLEVISLEEFAAMAEEVEFFPLEPEAEWDSAELDELDEQADLAEVIQRRFASLDDALTALINEIPMDVDAEIELAIDELYKSVDELEVITLH